MPTHIALIRAVNVTGTGKLVMADLRSRVTKLGYANVRTYIASGNLLVDSPKPAATVHRELTALVTKMLGKPATLFLRSPAALAKLLENNPFPRAEPSKVIVVFLDRAPAPDALKDVVPPGPEELALVGKELFIHFPDGMGKSRFRAPLMDIGTGRNLNTVRTLLEMARTKR